MAGFSPLVNVRFRRDVANALGGTLWGPIAEAACDNADPNLLGTNSRERLFSQLQFVV